jgi:hypothetical protein
VIVLFDGLKDQSQTNPKTVKKVSVEDLVLSNAYQLEAMVNVLERKGLLTKAGSVGGVEEDAGNRGQIDKFP